MVKIEREKNEREKNLRYIDDLCDDVDCITYLQVIKLTVSIELVNRWIQTKK